ncbi:hypothetical protein WJX72_006016 [[Myrmecia] bisecta]|uniref:Uncharacterized protein n=1 Tax=[Myrmecia] bisecta TaxID=41462 RepID=A0AAW1Q783_9CHLO
MQPLQVEAGTRELDGAVRAVDFISRSPPYESGRERPPMKRQSSLVRQLSRLLRPNLPSGGKHGTVVTARQQTPHSGLGGLPWRTEALQEALLHLDSWSGWYHRSNGCDVVRTLITDASRSELNHMIANSDMERFWRLCSHDVRDALEPRLPELRPSACDAMLTGLQKLGIFQKNLGLRDWWVDWVRAIILNLKAALPGGTCRGIFQKNFELRGWGIFQKNLGLRGWWVDWVRAIILNLKGTELTALKNAIDDGGDAHNLHQLIFGDILDHSVRDDLLAHIAQEATAVRGQGWRALKVMSDIDDTFLCSGGHFPSGVDKRFPKGTIYPGVIALYRALTEAQHYRKMARVASMQNFQANISLTAPGNNNRVAEEGTEIPDEVTCCALDPLSEQLAQVRLPSSSTLANASQQLGSSLEAPQGPVQQFWVNLSEGQGDAFPRLPSGEPIFETNLVLLSARPGGKRGGGLLTRLTYGRFAELVASGHMHALPTLLPGQFHAGLKAVRSILRRIFVLRDRNWKAYTKAWAPVGLHKYHSFMEYAQLYPEYDFVFFGDNGQGDAFASDRIIEKAETTGLLQSRAGVLSSFGTDDSLPQFHGALIHVVQDTSHTLRATKAESDETSALLSAEEGNAASNRFFYIRSFVHAALVVHEMGLLDLAGVKQVALEAQEDFYRLMARAKLGQTNFQRWQRHQAYGIQQELNRDVALLNEMLPEAERLDMLDMCPPDPTFSQKRRQ